ncbi:hypothetical protein HPB50_019600 [Hyalomma asiaticum]|uniref:Uncharacterized protein n=1 Tax=Hyalomma asiaticum TaxID=266040 RepID=A0ACB7TND5_HYAAI|nr:hypothetical protein HPB50_019600 [Hyalomma asiaticum]
MGAPPFASVKPLKHDRGGFSRATTEYRNRDLCNRGATHGSSGLQTQQEVNDRDLNTTRDRARCQQRNASTSGQPIAVRKSRHPPQLRLTQEKSRRSPSSEGARRRPLTHFTCHSAYHLASGVFGLKRRQAPDNTAAYQCPSSPYNHGCRRTVVERPPRPRRLSSGIIPTSISSRNLPQQCALTVRSH